MCNRQLVFRFKLNSMNDCYARLREAARELRGWDTQAEVARGLSAGGFTASDQTLTNWKNRGISSDGILEACRIIGCRTEYLRAGSLPMADAKPSNGFGSVAQRAAELISALSPEDQVKILHYLQVAAEKNKPPRS